MFKIADKLMDLIEQKTANFVPATAGAGFSMLCGCSGNCGQSCAGGCESGCSGDCGRSCSGSAS